MFASAYELKKLWPGERYLRAHRLVAILILLPLLQTVAQEKAATPRPPVLDLGRCAAFGGHKDDRETICLRGKVKTIHTDNRSVLRTAGGWIDDHTTSFIDETYDERGNRVERVGHNRVSGVPGYAESRTVHSFDDKGRATGSKTYERGNSEPSHISEMAYDEKGNRSRITHKRSTLTENFVVTITYDEEGRIAEQTHDNFLRPELSRKVVITYEGKSVHTSTYTKDGRLVARGVTVSEKSGDTVTDKHYSINAKGEKTFSRSVTTKFNAKGLLVEIFRRESGAGHLGSRDVYDYDEMGNIKSLTRYRVDGSFDHRAHHQYEYDDQGNWVTLVNLSQRAEADKPEPYWVVRRVITYF